MVIIKTLEIAGLLISKSLNVFDTTKSDLKSIPGGVGQKAKYNINSVLSKNHGYAQISKNRDILEDAGLNPSPFDCFLVFRGLKTLPLRMRQHQKNSIEIAKFLESHPLVIKVMHSWLPSHPMHEVAKKQFSGHSGMVAFYIKGGLKEASSFLKNLKLITMRGSLGGVGSIIEIPTVLSHASIPKNMKAEIGITDNLIRFSVGVENVEDLIADLDQAFLKMKN
ncbi:Cystathionine gamma-lyase [Blattella germanica]|nr:Cystathionine gamma-lyase [Blattella germanica]